MLYVLSEHCISESFCVGANAGCSPPISGLPVMLPQALQSPCFQRWVTLISQTVEREQHFREGLGQQLALANPAYCNHGI